MSPDSAQCPEQKTDPEALFKECREYHDVFQFHVLGLRTEALFTVCVFFFCAVLIVFLEDVMQRWNVPSRQTFLVSALTQGLALGAACLSMWSVHGELRTMVHTLVDLSDRLLIRAASDVEVSGIEGWRRSDTYNKTYDEIIRVLKLHVFVFVIEITLLLHFSVLREERWLAMTWLVCVAPIPFIGVCGCLRRLREFERK